jgi:glucose-1-phosphate adenylyltransferase
MKSDIGFATRIAGTIPPTRTRSAALILSDEPTIGLDRLTVHRCKAALPFGGKYRLIDFALSNCANSGISTVGVITQYRPRSLHAHLDYGRPWDLDRYEGGLTLLHPYQADVGIGWYKGSADAICQNLEFILHSRADHVLVLSGCEIYCVDLDRLIAYHHEAGADLTIGAAVAAGKRERARLITDHQGWVHRLVPAGSDAVDLPAMMGMMVFSADALSRRLSEDTELPGSTHDLVRDVIPRMIEDGDRVLAFHHTGYWSGLQTVYDYWQSNLSLSNQTPRPFDDPGWPIRTRCENRPPAHILGGASVSYSLVSEGCVIEGTVERSILSPGVRVAAGAAVRDAVVMRDTVVGEGALVERAVLDRDVVVGSGARVTGKVPHQAWVCSVSECEQIAVVERGTPIPSDRIVEPPTWNGDWLMPARVASQGIVVAQPGVISRMT